MRLFAVTLLLLVGFSSAASAAQRTWVTDDFFFESMTPQEYFAASPRLRATDCRAQVARAVCVVGGNFEASGPTMTRRCAANATRYVAFFEAVYDAFPKAVQQMFCSVQTINVESTLTSVAYGGMTFGGAQIGIRKSLIDEALDVSTLISWKEQLPLGVSRDSYTVNPELPRVQVSGLNTGIETLAFYVIAHEFGHLFDFSNDLNSFRNCSGHATGSDSCIPASGSWTALSWKTGRTPRPENDYAHRREVCFYDCGAPLAKSAVSSLYAGLAKTSFVTLYASTNPYDDLAETMAFFMLAAQPMGGYMLDTRQGERYDLLAKLKAPEFAAKHVYMSDFLSRSDIEYP